VTMGHRTRSSTRLRRRRLRHQLETVFPALLNEDGSRLLREDGNRVRI